MRVYIEENKFQRETKYTKIEMYIEKYITKKDKKFQERQNVCRENILIMFIINRFTESFCK